MQKFMRAARVAAPGRITVEEAPLPEPGPGDIRVRLEGCGVCGSNLPPWEGRPWFQYPLQPGELGHEGWGVIDAIGPKVTRFAIGDRVALLSYRAYAEYDVAPEPAAVLLPKALDGLPFPGEALGCAYNVFRRCDISKGQKVAVIGAGFLGSVLVALCARAGAEVMAITRRPFALEVAGRLGAAELVPWADDIGPIQERVRAWTGREGCERVIEAVGVQSSLALASELTRERGRLIIAGFHQDGPRQVNMQLWNWRGLDVINAHERDPEIYRLGMELAAKAVAEGALDPSPLYTHHFKLEHLGDALDMMLERPDGFMKALVNP